MQGGRHGTLGRAGMKLMTVKEALFAAVTAVGTRRGSEPDGLAPPPMAAADGASLVAYTMPVAGSTREMPQDDPSPSDVLPSREPSLTTAVDGAAPLAWGVHSAPHACGRAALAVRLPVDVATGAPSSCGRLCRPAPALCAAGPGRRARGQDGAAAEQRARHRLAAGRARQGRKRRVNVLPPAIALLCLCARRRHRGRHAPPRSGLCRAAVASAGPRRHGGGVRRAAGATQRSGACQRVRAHASDGRRCDSACGHVR